MPLELLIVFGNFNSREQVRGKNNLLNSNTNVHRVFCAHLNRNLCGGPG